MHFPHPLPGRITRRGTAAAAGLLAFVAAPAGYLPEPAGDAVTVETAADRGYWPPEDWRQLLALDEPMRNFFAGRVHPVGTDGARLMEIVDAIIKPDGLNFAYEAEGTYDAREAFRRRRGNCASFAFLVVAAAREQGLAVQFQDIETSQQWDRFGRFIASVRHTNVRMPVDNATYVVDLRPDQGPTPAADTRYVVRDERAFAHFYSTNGFFHLVRGDVAGALHLMELATATDPRSPVVWSNLGNVHAQRGDLAAARSCFERTLRLNRYDMAALVGLVGVLQRQGRPEDAGLLAKYGRRVESYRARNPYYHYQLATAAATGGDWLAAEQSLRRAIRLKDDEELFQEQLAEALRHLGRPSEAAKVDKRLAELRDRIKTPASRVER
ncbi:MAG TPA: tetratricopeptide repeat protein [Lacunisphaera sp.]|nr:tetratricopeptide repeat protein [Lacunisphaera sp.]